MKDLRTSDSESIPTTIEAFRLEARQRDFRVAAHDVAITREVAPQRFPRIR